LKVSLDLHPGDVGGDRPSRILLNHIIPSCPYDCMHLLANINSPFIEGK
jgi:hypothetical protein